MNADVLWNMRVRAHNKQKKNRNKKFDSLDSKSLASSIDEMSQLLDELSVGGGSAGERLATDITDII